MYIIDRCRKTKRSKPTKPTCCSPLRPVCLVKARPFDEHEAQMPTLAVAMRRKIAERKLRKEADEFLLAREAEKTAELQAFKSGD